MSNTRKYSKLVVIADAHSLAVQAMLGNDQLDDYDVTVTTSTGSHLPGDVYLSVATNIDDLSRWLPESQRPRTFFLGVSPAELQRAGAVGFGDADLDSLAAEKLLVRLAKLVEKRPIGEAVFSEVVLPNLHGKAHVFLETIELLQLYAPSEVPVLVGGETGTGKELAARAIHYLSDRATNPFVPVNCGALPDTLFENELFGHQAGAYTDAKKSSHGLVEEAEGGTLFLDEIEALSQHGQVALLRFLQTKEYRTVGGSRLRQSDVRVIAAGNTVFADAMKSGAFREDLYYRLAVGMVTLPPLRQRDDDAQLLAHIFLEGAQRDLQSSRGFSPSALEFISRYDWPGNVRQLENFVLRYVLIGDRAITDDEPLNTMPPRPAGPLGEENLPMQLAKRQAVDAFEKTYLQSLLTKTQGNLTHAATLAGKDRSVLSRLLKKHGLTRDQFKRHG